MTREAGITRGAEATKAIIHLIGAVLLEAGNEWQPKHRYMGIEASADLLDPTETLQLPAKAA